MVDPNTAKAGLQALAVAIAEIMEGAQELTIRPVPSKPDRRLARLAGLRTVGEDIGALAAAMEVLERRRTVHTK